MIWASPGLVSNKQFEDSVPILICSPSLTVHVQDPYPGADPVDLFISSLLEQGFALVTELNPRSLSALGTITNWHVELDGRDAGKLRVVDWNGRYSGDDFAEGAPEGWTEALIRQEFLVLLVATDIELGCARRVLSLGQAREAGNLVGVRVPLRRSWLGPARHG